MNNIGYMFDIPSNIKSFVIHDSFSMNKIFNFHQKYYMYSKKKLYQ